MFTVKVLATSKAIWDPQQHMAQDPRGSASVTAYQTLPILAAAVPKAPSPPRVVWDPLLPPSNELPTFRYGKGLSPLLKFGMAVGNKDG